MDTISEVLNHGFAAQTREDVPVESLDLSGVSVVDFVLVTDGAVATAIREGFRGLDANNDGQISLAESGLSSGEFDALDANSDGFLTLDELLEATVGPVGVQTPVWVTFTYTGEETGEETTPFDTLDEGVTFVAEGGEVRVEGQTSQTQTGAYEIDKDVTLTAANGTVRIGAVAARATMTSLTGAKRNADAGSDESGGGSLWTRFLRALFGDGDLDKDRDGDKDKVKDEEEDLGGEIYYELVMPFAVDKAGVRWITGDMPVSIRLVGEGPIDTSTLWAEVPADLRDHVSVDWISHDASLGDVWVRVTPDRAWSEIAAGAYWEIRAGNEGLVSDAYEFAVDGRARAAGGVVPELRPGVGLLYRIQPGSVYEEAVDAEIPVPEGALPGALMYYSERLSDWVPLERVSGFAGARGELEDARGRVVVLEAHHGGLVGFVNEAE